MQLFYNLILHNADPLSCHHFMKAPSMTDVATLAGVSHATVSRIVNGRPGVSSETEARVRRAMAELQYLAPPSENRPGRSAKPPREKIVRHIALLTFDHALTEHSAFVASIYEGARRAAAEQGIAVSLLSLDDFNTVPDWIHPNHIDGLLLHGLRSRSHLIRSASEIPSLWLTTHEDGGVDAVLPGNQKVGEIAADYLADREHRVVAALSIDLQNSSYRVRLDSFRDQASKRGMGRISCRLTASDLSKHQTPEERMTALIRKLLQQDPADRPTGIFCPSDLMTALAYSACQEAGIRPGADFEFVSCDNEKAYLTGLFPRPTTIDLGTEDRGRLALELLLARIRDPGLDRKAALILEPLLLPSEGT